MPRTSPSRRPGTTDTCRSALCYRFGWKHRRRLAAPTLIQNNSGLPKDFPSRLRQAQRAENRVGPSAAPILCWEEVPCLT